MGDAWHERPSGQSLAVDVQERWAEADGFSGVVWDSATNRVTVYWHGEVPPQLTTQLEQVSSRGTRVSVSQSAFTSAELQTEAQRLADAFPIVKVVSPRPDGAGLEVEVVPGAIADSLARGIDLSAQFSARYPVQVTGESEPSAI